MATMRPRTNGTFEFIIKRKNLLPKPISLTFDTADEGKEYCARLEALLDQGIIPDEFKANVERFDSLGDLIQTYADTQHIKACDMHQIPTMVKRLKDVKINEVDYQWIEGWIAQMKAELGLSPSSIRHYIGVLGRCLDWAGKKYAQFAINPVRLLPKRYASYAPNDVKAAAAFGNTAVKDEIRERRLEHGEEERIRAILNGEKAPGAARVLKLDTRPAFECMFDIALETAMRMKEIYTLTLDQIDFEKRTIYLTKTKNGDNRQVPMSTVASSVLRRYLERVESGDSLMDGYSIAENGNRLFPWWDGTYSELEFKLATSRLSQQFSRVFKAANCEGLRFHDLRHEATSRIFERTTLTDVQISRITGHRDPRMLRRYSNLRGSDLADRLW